MVTKTLFRWDFLVVGAACAGEPHPHVLPWSPEMTPHCSARCPPWAAAPSLGHRQAAALLWRWWRAWLTQREACQQKARQVHPSKRQHWSSPRSSARAKRCAGRDVTWWSAALAGWRPEVWLLPQLSELRQFLPALPCQGALWRNGVASRAPTLREGPPWRGQCSCGLRPPGEPLWGAAGGSCENGGKARGRAGARGPAARLGNGAHLGKAERAQLTAGALPPGLAAAGASLCWRLKFSIYCQIPSRSSFPSPAASLSVTPGACRVAQGRPSTWGCELLPQLQPGPFCSFSAPLCFINPF